MLEMVSIEPKAAADACVIWLHGLGADGHDFVPVLPQLGLPRDHTIRFLFPHAPRQAITINQGMIMPAWYDIAALDLQTGQDEQGIRKTEQALRNLLTQLIEQGIASKRIILMGFSQGGAVALHTAVRFEKPLGGVGVLSAYLPLQDCLATQFHIANHAIPIFMAHGLMDPVVPYGAGEKSFHCLKSNGFAPTWHAYPMAHMVCLPELHDIGQWIQQVLK